MNTAQVGKTAPIDTVCHSSYIERMDTKIISHGAIKHAEGAPCKICDRMAKAHSKSEARRLEAQMSPEVVSTDNGSEPVRTIRTFTEEQVAAMLEEVQKTTTHRIFQKLYAMCDQKQNDLSFPALRKFELEALEQEYENDPQSPSRQ